MKYTEGMIRITEVVFLGVFILSSIFFYTYKNTGENSNVLQKVYTRVETKTDYGVRVDFFDESGNDYAPWGYFSTIEQQYDEEGRVSIERYFFDNQPIALSFGQFGVQYGYDVNGKKVKTTFLDKEGKTMNGSCGYATVQKTFYDDGSVKDERYFDKEGMPAKNVSGQYGIRHIKNRLIYLDSNGRVKFDLKLMISQDQWIIPIVGIILCLILTLSPRKIVIAIQSCYLGFIFFQTLVGRPEGAGSVELRLFWSYRQFFKSDTLRIEILNNIWIFVPFGAGLRSIFNKKWTYLFILLCPVCIEVVQGIWGLGLCEFDDIFSNTFGGIIGLLMACEIERVTYWIMGRNTFRRKREQEP